MKSRKILTAWLIAFMLLVFAGSAFADITTGNLIRTMWGNKRVHIFDVAFDSSYSYEGEDLFTTASVAGYLSSVDTAIIYDSGGYSFKYDVKNKKVKVFGPAPPIIYEEEHQNSTTAAVTGFLLDYPAAYIMAIVDSSGTPFQLIYSGTTTLTQHKASLSSPIASGERTGVSIWETSLGTNTFLVTYVTQAWQDVYALLVQNEEIAISTGVSANNTTTGQTIFAYGWGKTGASAVTPVTIQATGLGQNELGVGFGHSGTTSSNLRVHSSNDGQTLFLTYLKYPPENSWLLDRLIWEDEDGASGASINSLDRSLLMWNISGYAFSSGNSSYQIGAEDVVPSATYGPGVGGESLQPAWGYRGIAADAAAPDNHQVWGRADAIVNISDAVYVYGHPWEIPNLQQLEVMNGTDLSALTGIKVILIGR